MGAQHDFGFSFSPNDFISPMPNEAFEAKTDSFLFFLKRENYVLDCRESEISIIFSFYSSYDFAKKVRDEVKTYLKSILKEGTIVDCYCEEIKRSDESFTV